MTRLHPVLEPDACADLHRRLVLSTLDKLTTAGLCPVELWCTPDCGHPFFDACRRDYAISLHVQSGEDIGRRMHHAIGDALQRSKAVVLTGTDCPSLLASDIDEALAALRAGTDLVLGPARDGGYYLIGMPAQRRRMFSNIAWGTGEVLSQTLMRAREAGLRVHQLTQRDDVDRPEDYTRMTGHVDP
jgi:rSAM/selenodomain-associated transferase 1